MSDEKQSVGGVDVSRETFENLEKLSALIIKWTKSINLIAPKSVPDLWDRHIVDSAQVFLRAPPNWTSWIDLGSGGGLPGLVVAIMDDQRRPLSLIESDKRKCLFLTTARREFDLNITVVNDRIETAVAESADILSARALSPLNDLLTYATKFLNPDGFALFPKGARYKEELDQAAQAWHFDVTAHESLTNPESRILQLSRIRRREP